MKLEVLLGKNGTGTGVLTWMGRSKIRQKNRTPKVCLGNQKLDPDCNSLSMFFYRRNKIVLSCVQTH